MDTTMTSNGNALAKPQSPTQIALYRLLEDKIALVCIGVLLLFFLMALGAAHITPYDPYHAFPERSLLPPSWSHLMGTDLIGRDVFSRVLFGARISMLIGFVSVGISASIGVTLGLIAGYYGRYRRYAVIMRFIDTLMAFPGILSGVDHHCAAGSRNSQCNDRRRDRGRSELRSTGARVRPFDQGRSAYVDAARSVGARDWRIIVDTISCRTHFRLFWC